MVKLIAKRPLSYGRATVPRGGEFAPSERDADMLIAAGRAMRAADEAPPATEAPRRGRYKRRDLRAEDAGL